MYDVSESQIHALMKQPNEHRITVKITGSEVFKLPVAENEESFYRAVIEKINKNINGLCQGVGADRPTVALAKVALYYATILYRRTEAMAEQSRLLDDFEATLDSLLAGTD